MLGCAWSIGWGRGTLEREASFGQNPRVFRQRAGVLLRRFGDEAARDLDVLLRELALTQMVFTADHAAIAREAFRRFGKGRHPASLNFGDCIPYALARALNEPLLFVGDDFSRTDVEVAAY